MANQKKILNYCPNFNEIVNCDFFEDDIFTKKLIQYYQDFIFSINEEDENEIEMIRQLDIAMYKYVDDYRFAKNLKETLDTDTIVAQNFSYLDQLMRYIVGFFVDYEKQEVRNIFHSKWI